MQSKLHPSKVAAEKLGIAPVTLRIWRMKGRGPKYVKQHGLCYYSDEAIQEYLDSLPTLQSTSEEAVIEAEA